MNAAPELDAHLQVARRAYTLLEIALIGATPLLAYGMVTGSLRLVFLAVLIAGTAGICAGAAAHRLYCRAGGRTS